MAVLRLQRRAPARPCRAPPRGPGTTRGADLAEVNGFASRLAPLDDYAGKLPEQGGVLIFCASYNGAPPDNATQFVKWLHGDITKDALSKVRYAMFGCGNSDW